jgi:hypothetical protein
MEGLVASFLEASACVARGPVGGAKAKFQEASQWLQEARTHPEAISLAQHVLGAWSGRRMGAGCAWEGAERG